MVTLALGGCGADSRLDRQEAEARARTCATLTERNRNVPVTVPFTIWFLPNVRERADSQATPAGRRRGNPTELKDDCRRATGQQPL